MVATVVTDRVDALFLPAAETTVAATPPLPRAMALPRDTETAAAATTLPLIVDTASVPPHPHVEEEEAASHTTVVELVADASAAPLPPAFVPR